MSATEQTLEARLGRLLDQQDIADVIYRYCRGIDRRDFDLVRSCYHPDATDSHGDFEGPIDAFLEYVQTSLQRFQGTMHFVGNLLIEPVGDRARAESYVIAFHRVLPTPKRPMRDYNVFFRYVDDFERRNGEWRIAARVCSFEWTRMDPVPDGSWAPPPDVLSRFGAADVVFAPSVRDWRPLPVE